MSNKNNIIKFPKEFQCNYDPTPVNKVLLNADKMDLDEVIVLGLKDGAIQILSSESCIERIIYLCEYSKALITKSVIGDLYLDIKQD